MIAANILRQIFRSWSSVLWRILTSHVTRDKNTISQFFGIHWDVFSKKKNIYQDTVMACVWTKHVKNSQLVNKMCSQQTCGKLVNKL